MNLYIKVYLVTLSLFLGFDGLWFGLLAKGFYSKHLGYIMRSPPLWGAAAVFYVLNTIGILIFVITPALEKTSLGRAIVLGMLFGFFTYATYNLTNLATIRDWPMVVCFVDIGWGVIVTGATSGLGYLVATKLI